MNRILRMLAVLLAIWPSYAAAQDVPKQRIGEARAAGQAVAEVEASRPPAVDFDTQVARQAALEVQLGLRFYAEYDDYRAITSFKRYRLLQPDNQHAQFLSALMIGQIYHRNEKPELAALAFEQASEVAKSPYQQTFAYLMGLQELCLPLSFYVQCRYRLEELRKADLEPQLADLVEYQTMYTDLVLRQDNITEERARLLQAESLREKALGLVAQDQAFRDLSLKRPWLSGTLSGLLPGAGQLYNGRPVDALLAFTVNGALGVGTFFAFERENIPLGVALSVLLAGFYTGNIVNAVVDSKRINAKRYQAFFETLKREHWPRVAFVIEEDEVLFTYGFDWPGPSLKSKAEASVTEPPETKD